MADDKDSVKKRYQTSPLSQGYYDKYPGLAPHDYCEPVPNAKDLTQDPFLESKVNKNYNDLRYATNFGQTYTGHILTNAITIPTDDENSDNWDIMGGIASFFGSDEDGSNGANMEGYYHVRVPTLHDGVLPVVGQFSSIVVSAFDDLIPFLYPRAYINKSEFDDIAAGALVELQALDINRNNFLIVSVIGNDANYSKPSDGPLPYPPAPAGPTPLESGDTILTGSDACNDNGNFKAVKGASVNEAYHTLNDFIPTAGLPLLGGYANLTLGSPPCERPPPRNPDGTVLEGATTDHKGQDIDALVGTPVSAPADGRVIFTDHAEGTLVVWHPSSLQEGKEWEEVKSQRTLKTVYLHMERISAAVGAPVSQGQELGQTGTRGKSTGPHLHYEIRWGTGMSQSDLKDRIAPFRALSGSDIPPGGNEYQGIYADASPVVVSEGPEYGVFDAARVEGEIQDLKEENDTDNSGRVSPLDFTKKRLGPNLPQDVTPSDADQAAYDAYEAKLKALEKELEDIKNGSSPS